MTQSITVINGKGRWIHGPWFCIAFRISGAIEFFALPTLPLVCCLALEWIVGLILKILFFLIFFSYFSWHQRSRHAPVKTWPPIQPRVMGATPTAKGRLYPTLHLRILQVNYFKFYYFNQLTANCTHAIDLSLIQCTACKQVKSH